MHGLCLLRVATSISTEATTIAAQSTAAIAAIGARHPTVAMSGMVRYEPNANGDKVLYVRELYGMQFLYPTTTSTAASNSAAAAASPSSPYYASTFAIAIMFPHLHCHHLCSRCHLRRLRC